MRATVQHLFRGHGPLLRFEGDCSAGTVEGDCSAGKVDGVRSTGQVEGVGSTGQVLLVEPAFGVECGHAAEAG